jgi:hypothetical protein
VINVNDLYLKVSDAALKNQAGYQDPDQFNRDLDRAQTLLQNFYLSKYDREGRVHDALRPFTARENKQITLGFSIWPSDMVKEIEVYRRTASNLGECGDEPTVTDILARYIKGHERGAIMQSTVRRPALSQGHCFYMMDSGIMEHLPYTDSGFCFIRYIRRPNTATWAADLDDETLVYTYNEDDSVNLEWGAEEEDNFVDILLLLLGIQIRETELIQFVSGKKQLIAA